MDVNTKLISKKPVLKLKEDIICNIFIRTDNPNFVGRCWHCGKILSLKIKGVLGY